MRVLAAVLIALATASAAPAQQESSPWCGQTDEAALDDIAAQIVGDWTLFELRGVVTGEGGWRVPADPKRPAPLRIETNGRSTVIAGSPGGSVVYEGALRDPAAEDMLTFGDLEAFEIRNIIARDQFPAIEAEYGCEGAHLPRIVLYSRYEGPEGDGDAFVILAAIGPDLLAGVFLFGGTVDDARRTTGSAGRPVILAR